MQCFSYYNISSFCSVRYRVVLKPCAMLEQYERSVFKLDGLDGLDEYVAGYLDYRAVKALHK